MATLRAVLHFRKVKPMKPHLRIASAPNPVPLYSPASDLEHVSGLVALLLITIPSAMEESGNRSASGGVQSVLSEISQTLSRISHNLKGAC